jgi:hypothetical protein
MSDDECLSLLVRVRPTAFVTRLLLVLSTESLALSEAEWVETSLPICIRTLSDCLEIVRDCENDS